MKAIFCFGWISLVFLSALVRPARAQIAPQPVMELTSPDFTTGATMPERFTCQGGSHAPKLRISKVPKAARSLILMLEDRDAPTGTVTHWLLWNIDPETTEFSAESLPARAVQGTNDFSKTTYVAPCPDSGRHRYYYRLFAVDGVLNLPTSTRRPELERILRGRILEEATLMGRYERPNNRRD